MTRRQIAGSLVSLAILTAVFLLIRRVDGPVRVTARATPEPMLFEMHNYDAKQFPAEWGKIGSWMYWGADQIAVSFDVIDEYLARVNAPTAISIMLIEGIGADSTPYAAWGIPEGGWVEGAYSYPRWNDQRWDNAYRALVRRLGAKYDSDPRVHSVWICAGLYGEAIWEKSDWKATGHNPTRFAQNAIDWHVQAFPTKPLFFIGSVTQRGLCEYAAQNGVGVKLNSLGADLPTHWRPRDSSGSLGIMSIVSQTVATGWEHAFSNTPAQAYHAALVGLSFGMDVLDLPEEYLQTMADTPVWTGESLLAWTRRMMQSQERTHFWVGRQTAYPCPAGSYDCGWPYPLAWRAKCNDGCVNLHTTRDLPAPLKDSAFGLLGAGHLTGAATFDVKPGHMTAILAGDITISAGGQSQRTQNTGDWEVIEMDARGEQITLAGDGYAHLLLVEEGTTMETPTPYLTETPKPLTATPVLTPTQTWTPMPTVTVTATPKPNPTYEYIDVLAKIEDLEQAVDSLTEDNIAQQAEINQLKGWVEILRADLDRVLKLLDSWQGDGK